MATFEALLDRTSKEKLAHMVLTLRSSIQDVRVTAHRSLEIGEGYDLALELIEQRSLRALDASGGDLSHDAGP